MLARAAERPELWTHLPRHRLATALGGADPVGRSAPVPPKRAQVRIVERLVHPRAAAWRAGNFHALPASPSTTTAERRGKDQLNHTGSIPRDFLLGSNRTPDELSRLAGEIDVDIAIIGGGMVEITAARLLKDARHDRRRHRGAQGQAEVTGKSTAKVTSQHNLIYHKLKRKFGEDGAQDACSERGGDRLMADLASRHGIDCDFEPKSAYTYARTDEHLDAVEREVEAARGLGLPASFTPQAACRFRWRERSALRRSGAIPPVQISRRPPPGRSTAMAAMSSSRAARSTGSRRAW